MATEIKNNPDNTKRIASDIGSNAETTIPKANGTSEVSNDGLTARYSDVFLDMLDINLHNSFDELMSNSKAKFSMIAEDFEQTDKNASV